MSELFCASAKRVGRISYWLVTLQVLQAVRLVWSHLKVSQPFLSLGVSWLLFCHLLDVIEEIISEEIVDETDQFEDNQSKRRAKRMTTAAVMRGCVFPFSNPPLTQLMMADGY